MFIRSLYSLFEKQTDNKSSYMIESKLILITWFNFNFLLLWFPSWKRHMKCFEAVSSQLFDITLLLYNDADILAKIKFKQLSSSIWNFPNEFSFTLPKLLIYSVQHMNKPFGSCSYLNWIFKILRAFLGRLTVPRAKQGKKFHRSSAMLFHNFLCLGAFVIRDKRWFLNGLSTTDSPLDVSVWFHLFYSKLRHVKSET
jgi:hypothetical protein